MKSNFLVFLFLMGIFNYAATQNYTAKSTNIGIQENSTMHKWSSKVNKSSFSGTIDVENGEIKAIKAATLKVTVNDIKSDKDSGMMDSRTYKALNSEKFPTITYTFST